MRHLDPGTVDSFILPASPGSSHVLDVTDVSGRLGLLKVRVITTGRVEETCSGSLELVDLSDDALVEISDCIGMDAGDYTISFNATSGRPGACAPPLPCGASLEGADLDPAGEVDAYTFEGVAGTEVTLSPVVVGGAIGRLRVRVFDPDGMLLPGTDTCRETVAFRSTRNGPHTVLVSACGLPATGAYRLTLDDPSCPSGPEITYFGIAKADGTALRLTMFDEADRPIYVVHEGQVFSLVLEAKPGSSGEPVGTQAFRRDPANPSILPDLQALVSRPLGNGSTAVCDVASPAPGGVPASPALEFEETQSVSDSINHLGCRFIDAFGRPAGRTVPTEACTRSESGGFGFVEAESTVQFCALIIDEWSFPLANTIVAARVRDAAGMIGPRREIIVRVIEPGPARLVKDIVPGRNAEFDPASPQNLVAAGDVLYFTADDRERGLEVWRTDGTEAGTRIVRDIRPGLPSSFPTNLMSAGDRIFFVADDGIEGRSLWLSDGTEAGTHPVADPSNDLESIRFDLAVGAGGMLFFVRQDEAHGAELWRTDGTAEGTFLLRDIRPGPESSSPTGFLASNQGLFFRAFDDAHGYELWKTNGTPGGTALVKDVYPGPESSTPMDLTEVGNTIFFSADNPMFGRELWKSDGTEEGTSLVKDISVVGFNRPSSNPSALTAMNGLLFFVAAESRFGAELWTSDGTAEGTVRVKDIAPGARSSEIGRLTASTNAVFFTARAEDSGPHALWRSDGTAEGTLPIAEILPQRFPPVTAGPDLYFAAGDTERGLELWRSGGTSSGTQRIHDIFPGRPSSFALSGNRSLVRTRTHLFFVADDGLMGAELWALEFDNRCAGDCDSSGEVTVDELVRAVNIALGNVTVDQCITMDRNGDSELTVDELVQAVNSALNGCVAFRGAQ